MDEPVIIVSREFDPKKDSPFVFSSWRNAAYYSASPARVEPPAEFFKMMTERIARTLFDAKVRIAGVKGDPDTIIGYSVVTGKHLDWVYVKPSFRECGVASSLVPTGIETYTSDLTKIGRAILDKRKAKEN